MAKPAYKVKELDSIKEKDVFSAMTREEISAKTAAERKVWDADVKSLEEKVDTARSKRDNDAVTFYNRKLRILKGIKRRSLRQYEVTFLRGHSNTFDEVAMSEQDLCEKAPLYDENAEELLPDSLPEGYIGLEKGEFVVSNTQVPIFDK